MPAIIDLTSFPVNFQDKYGKLQVNTTKVERVNTMGNELKEDMNETSQKVIDDRLQQFNTRWETVSNRLKEFANRDLPEGTDCFFVRLLRRRLFRSSQVAPLNPDEMMTHDQYSLVQFRQNFVEL